MKDRLTIDGWNRRELLAGAALLTLAAGIPSSALALARKAANPRHAVLMRQVAQLVIPRTATAGAGEVGVGAFVILALEHGLEGSRGPYASEAITAAVQPHLRADGSLRYADWLEAALNSRARGMFVRQPPARKVAILKALDAEAYASGAVPSPWKTIKALILLGYYTSEVGGSKELRYELAPGRWDPDLPLKPGDRAFSSDWTAVDFG